jgi:DNA invertase Pin-like site-specific DNA recombinase
MPIVLAYGRVSSDRQADAGALERQEQALLKESGADEVLTDVGSGTNTNRPGYQRMLELIKSGQVSKIVVADQDRLNRQVSADLELWGLCEAAGTSITTLDGRPIEFRTPDGALLSTINSALNAHRSALYGQKIRRGLEAGRAQGKPTRSSVPFGLSLQRDGRGRPSGVELDPKTAPLARQRIDWFLEGVSMTNICKRSADLHGVALTVVGLNRWIKNPMLTGRLCWHRRPDGTYEHVADEQTFDPLMTDAEAHRIQIRLATLKTERGIRGRRRRPFSGLVKCHHCGKSLLYIQKRAGTEYLRCGQFDCPSRLKYIRADQIFGVLQFSLAMHARKVAPLLGQPRVDPPEVLALRREIQTLQGISGTEEVVAAKQAELQRLQGEDADTPIRALVAALRLPHFWLQDDEPLNDSLRLLVTQVVVDLAESAATAKVVSVECRCNPAEAPLPPDQRNILLPVFKNDLLLAASAE